MNDHYTPTGIIEAATRVMGSIDLDPASCEIAQKNVRAARWFGPGSPDGECGLRAAPAEKPAVFLNPPGGLVPPEFQGLGTKSSAGLWWAVWSDHWLAGRIEQMIFVGFNIELLRYGQSVGGPSPLDFPLCVPAKRIRFLHEVASGQLEPGKSPTHANVIVYLPPAPTPRDTDSSYRDKSQVFKREFSIFGQCR